MVARALDESEYGRWMSMARRTLESARRDLEGGDYNWACFKAQQAAEFAVEAFLYGIGEPRVGHAVSQLLAYINAPPDFEVIPLTREELLTKVRRCDLLAMDLIEHGVGVRDDLGLCGELGLAGYLE